MDALNGFCRTRPVAPCFDPGTVWLAGAGPGDPGLLTLNAYAGLAQADVILYDALVGPEILAFARPEARLVSVGKRAGRPRPGQAWINDQLVAQARLGQRVLRLKGGDPLVFGRGGEEALALLEAGITFRVVPGVSAGIGGLAYAGIPVTHRGLSSAVTFVTGHASDGALPSDIDWDALARSGGTLVIYMGMRSGGAIAQRLIAGGLAPETPAAIVVEATTEVQRTVVTTLGELGRRLSDINAAGPGLVVIGAVATLAAPLGGWFDDAMMTGGEHARHPEPALDPWAVLGQFAVSTVS
ncbi:MAG: uroporphyrinogen-III C-methyltransferase [Azospirillaceae bacterium]